MCVSLYRAFIFFATSIMMISFSAQADGGISIQGTRIVYPQDSRQESISVRNSSATKSFLVQSWVENPAGEKTQDFLVTPPLYLSGPGNDNRLRLVKTNSNLPNDRESLYYFVAKAIPSVSNDDTNKSVIRISAANRIKLFVRPAGLNMRPDAAPAELTFRHNAGKLLVDNPTPYYITLTNIKLAGRPVSGIMLAPKSVMKTDIAVKANDSIAFSTINDVGALRPVTISKIKND